MTIAEQMSDIQKQTEELKSLTQSERVYDIYTSVKSASAEELYKGLEDVDVEQLNKLFLVVRSLINSKIKSYKYE